MKQTDQQSPPATAVIFRIWPKSEGGDIIAIFPSIPGTFDPHTCQSYQRIGQHGACDPMALTQALRLAKPSDYAELASELERIGCVLDIRRRIPRNALEIRRAAISAQNARADARAETEPAVIDWRAYRACNVCKVGAGSPCIHTRLQTTRGHDVTMDRPCGGRRRNEQK